MKPKSHYLCVFWETPQRHISSATVVILLLFILLRFIASTYVISVVTEHEKYYTAQNYNVFLTSINVHRLMYSQSQQGI